MRVLVTGGLGYIGAHMVKLLQRRNIEVVVLDNNWHQNPNKLHPDTQIIYEDIRHAKAVHHIFAEQSFDAVMHFASLIQVGESVHNPSIYYDNNVAGTITLLNAMVAHGVEYFIGSSTAAIFGEPVYTPIDEKHGKHPLSAYGRSKFIMEQMVADYEHAYQMKCGMLRYFNAAGCSEDTDIGELHEPETHLIPLILQVASGRRDKICVFGDDYDTPDGTCIRDYIHVMDLAEAHWLLLDYLKKGGKERHFNLGTGKGYSILDVIHAVENVTDTHIHTEIQGKRAGDPAVLIADGAKAKTMLHWQPQLSDLQTIVQHAWQWEKLLASKE